MGQPAIAIPGRNAPWLHRGCETARVLVPVGEDAPRPAYRPRDPRRTPLYRIVIDHYETLMAIWDDRFEPRFGRLGHHVDKQVRAYLGCGLFSGGCCRVRCEDCGHEFILPYSCKTRYLCTSCHERKALVWADWLVDEVLEDVPHRMWIFGIPKRIRPFFRYDASLLGQLSRIASKVLHDVLQEATGRDDMRPGIVSAVHTWNSDLTWAPHLHPLVTDGCLDEDGRFVRASLTRLEDLQRIEDAFRQEVLSLLRSRDLLTEDDVDAMLSWPHSGFRVHNEVKVLPGDRQGFIDVAKYMARPPVANARLAYDPDRDPLVHVHLKRPHWTTGRPELTFEPLEFLARLLQHLPEPHVKMWRQYGHYAPILRARRARAAAEAQAGADREAGGPSIPGPPDPEPPNPKRCNAAWASLISRVWGYEVLSCPRCGGKMRILAAIHDPDSLQRITEHFGLDTELPEPKPARDPPWYQQGLGFDEIPADHDELLADEEGPAENDVEPDPGLDEFVVDPEFDDGLPTYRVD
jgi:hypothetical protein